MAVNYTTSFFLLKNTKRKKKNYTGVMIFEFLNYKGWITLKISLMDYKFPTAYCIIDRIFV